MSAHVSTPNDVVEEATIAGLQNAIQTMRDGGAPLGVPMGMDLLARPFDEPLLLGLAYAFEQRARVRRPPLHTLWPD